MPADFTAIQAAINELSEQVAKTETVEASAIALINGFAVAATEAVRKALEADNAADATSIAAAKDAIETVRVRFAASGDALGAAVVANTPSA